MPIDEKKRGLAECLKHALLQDSPNKINGPHLRDCLDLLEANNPNPEHIFSCIQQTIYAKSDIIQAIHAGNKAAAHLLSYGHVDAEPREAASMFTLAHGDAVLLSLAVELSLAGAKDSFETICKILPFTQLAVSAKDINFDRTTMLRAYRNSAKPRFRAGNDRYYIINLPHVGCYADVQGDSIIELIEYEFNKIYETTTEILANLD